jgi:amino acid exporter
MTSALIEGIILGITLAFLIGPSFIALVQTSIHRGFYAGVQFAIGIALSDITLIALTYLGALQLVQSTQNQVTVGIIGGIILMGFGVYTFTRKQKITTQVPIEIKVQTGKLFKYISKGYFLNIFNPFLLVFWIGVVGLASSKYGIHSREMIIFFAGAIGAVILTDIFKCFIAHRIKQYLNFKTLTLINRVVGICLVGFGIGLIIRVFYFL